MKNIFLQLLVLTIVSLLLFPLSGCKKDKGSDNYLRGKIDGTPFSCHLNVLATPGDSGDDIISISGAWSATSSIRFYMDGQGSDINAGTYTFQTGKIYSVILFDNNASYSAGYACSFFSPCTFKGSGQITIHEINHQRIRGNFDFVAFDDPGVSKAVTEGEFYMKR